MNDKKYIQKLKKQIAELKEENKYMSVACNELMDENLKLENLVKTHERIADVQDKTIFEKDAIIEAFRIVHNEIVK